MRRNLDRVNRTVLVVLGLLLLAAGGYALLRSYGAFGSDQANAPLLLDDVRDWVHRNEDWFWPVAGVVAALVAFAALRWLWAQRPHPMPSDDLVYDGDHGSTVVRSSVLSDAVEDELQHEPLVENVRVGVEHESDATLLLTRLSVRDGTPVSAIADEIVRPAVQHCREATGRGATARVIVDYAESHRTVR